MHRGEMGLLVSNCGIFIFKTEELVDNEVCYYVYNKEKQEAEATTVKVEYETKCEEETQKVCPEQQYGHQGYCKTVKNQVRQSMS